MTFTTYNLAGARHQTVLPSAARTATPDTSEYTNINPEAAGLVLVVDVTALTATGTITVAIEGVDRTSGKTWALLASPTAIAATGTYVFQVHPNIAAVAGSKAQNQMPPVIRITTAHGNGVSITYSAGLHFTN